jgi:membrane protein YqaA with SNARE-associated domain
MFDKKGGQIETWLIDNKDDSKTDWVLGIFSFLEGSISLLPPSLLLIPILLSKQKKYFYYATLTTVTSVAGGILSYLIGFYFFESFGSLVFGAYGLATYIEKIEVFFNTHFFLTIFISSFVPVIPYKIFSLAAGFFAIPFVPFLIPVILGRGARYYLIAYLIKRFGENANSVLSKYTNSFAIVFIIVVVFLLLWQMF